MSESKTSRWKVKRVPWLNHPFLPKAFGYLFLVGGICFMVMHLVYYPYPQWKDSRLYDLEHPQRIQIDERLGWWATSEIHILAWIFLPLGLGMMGGAIGGVWTAWYMRKNMKRLSLLLTRHPFDSAALVEGVWVLPLFSPFAVIIVCDLLAPDYSLLDSETTFSTAWGIVFLSMYKPWADAYKRASVLIRQRNRAEAAEPS